MPIPEIKCVCGGTYSFQRGCGCLVCDSCEDHRGMCRCYCGWTPHGGDGYAELIEEGECIDYEY